MAGDEETKRSDDRWCKAERLAVAGAIAPRLRSQTESALRRRVSRVDINGNVVGFTTLAEVQKALLEKHKLEFDVFDGVKRTEIICELFGLPERIGPMAVGKKRCDKCGIKRCPDCGKAFPRSYAVNKRASAVPVCKACRKRRWEDSLPACSDCGKKIPRKAERPYRARWGDDVPLRCGGCSRVALIKPKPRCTGCGKEMPRLTLFKKRVASGGLPFCRACFNQERRAGIEVDRAARRTVDRQAAINKKLAREAARLAARARCIDCGKLLSGVAKKRGTTRCKAHAARVAFLSRQVDN